MLAGSIDFRYDGAGAASVYQDFQNLKELGTATHPNGIIFTNNADLTSVEFDFYPIVFNSFALSDQGQVVRAQVNFEGMDDPAVGNVATSPILTVLKTLTLVNRLAASMSV
jgi:hypothetical protein